MVPPDFSLPLHDAASVRVDRAQLELRQGRVLCVLSDTGSPTQCLVLAIESLTEASWQHLQASGLSWRAVFTAERLHALGWPQASTARSMLLSKQARWADVQALAAVQATTPPLDLLTDPQAASNAVELVLWLTKQARLTPALLMAEWPAATAALLPQDLLSIAESDIQQAHARHGQHAGHELRRVSDAQLPLSGVGDCKAVLFHEAYGHGEHVAIVVGEPDFSQAVQVRLHSSCLTGDVFGSLRCDCGEQLQRALAQLAIHGGVLLYLSQEGRGTGLANKLRAYGLQDTGLDTIDADRHLGFKGDERSYQVAVNMLRMLGITQVKLLTNNPKKIEALRAGDIQVAERIALIPPTNPHNERYIRTKTERAGHLKVDDEQDEG
ncbi:MAG: GTP cyclohydrolase II [Burkholderiales bacterium]